MKQVVPNPEMIISESISIAPGDYDFFELNGLIIRADNIAIDGCGATLIGGHTKLERDSAITENTGEFDYESLKKPDNSRELGFFGIGIDLSNRKYVTIKNLNFKGFDIGAHLTYCENIIFENCDFSGCFADPAWGWDDHGFHGGILMEHTCYSDIIQCSAVGVWDALNMRYSHNNKVMNNNFSHTSDTGIKLWNSCHNTINDNDFSYGIRIDPGEVHARDSSCVLIESGSNHNSFKRNNMTYGGDGLFIRVLNGWMSTDNLFEENDCSYANNNAVEAWADNNTYIGNIANYSSYGFWLGNSDNTVLIDNEVAYNGGIHNNAPEAFGNCGIAVVNGSGSHSRVEGNYIHDNMGPGIAIRYKKDYPSFHWIIQNNRIENNKDCQSYKGHGIYIKNARFLTFGSNSFDGNEGVDIYFDGNVSDVYYLKGGAEKQALVSIICDSPIIVVGKPVTFSVIESLNTRWDLGDGTVCRGNIVTHTYKKSGFYRLGVTCDNNQQAEMDFINVFVCEDACLISLSPDKTILKGDARIYNKKINKEWSVSSQGSLEISAFGGKQHIIEILTDPLVLDENITLSGYCRYLTDSEPDWNSEVISPIISFYQDENNYIKYEPSFKFSQMFSYNESRNNWVKFHLDEGFTSSIIGRVETVNSIKISFSSIDEGQTYMYIDALCFVPKYISEPEHISLSKPTMVSEYPRVIYEGAVFDSDTQAPVSGNQQLFGDATQRVIYSSKGFYGVEFGTTHLIDRIDIWFYENATKTLNAHNETVPDNVSIECKQEGQWITVLQTKKLRQQRNELKFSPIYAESVRVSFNGEVMAVYGFKVYNTTALEDITCKASKPNQLTVDQFEVKLRKELNDNGNPLGDLIVRVFELNNENQLINCLYETIVPEKEVMSGGITVIKSELKGLISDKKYALALGQTQTAKSRTEGDYYRWIAGHAGYNETFAIYTDSQTKKSDYNWGTAWLKVVCEGICADYSHDSEHVGTRFGIEDMHYRYMTFTMPNSTITLTDGIAAAGSGFKLSNETLTVDLNGRTASKLHIWLDKEGILLINNMPCSVQAGFNSIQQEFSNTISITSLSSIFTIYEIEALE